MSNNKLPIKQPAKPKIVTGFALQSGKSKENQKRKEDKKPAAVELDAEATHKSKWWNNFIYSKVKGNNTFLVNPDKPWYDQFQFQVTDGNVERYFVTSMDKLNQVEQKVSSIYQEEVQNYRNYLAENNSSEEKWMNNVVKTGTWSDKIAALTLRIQSSPFHNLEAIDTLLSIASKDDLRLALQVLEAIKDLCANNLLPSDRHLVDWIDQPLLHQKYTACNGLVAWFEKELKKRITLVLDIIEQKGLKSTILYFRKQFLVILHDLLSKKPEQEVRILSMLVNKLGDLDHKITHQATSLLLQLTKDHPAMKVVIIKEIRNFLYLKKARSSATNIAIACLTQIYVKSHEDEAATQLVDCYLSLFERALNDHIENDQKPQTKASDTKDKNKDKKKQSKKEHDKKKAKGKAEGKSQTHQKQQGSRLLMLLLNGTNKVFPYVKDISSFMKYVAAIFRIVHVAPSFTTSTQALLLLSHLAFHSSKNIASSKIHNKPENNGIEEINHEQLVIRYYRALYSKLLSDQILHKSKNNVFLNLLYRSVKNDLSDPRTMAFIKRILMCATHASPAIAAGLLFIVSEIVQHKPHLKAMFYTSSSCPLLNGTVTDTDNSQSMDDEANSIVTSHTSTEVYLLDNLDANKRDPEFAIVGGNVPPVLHELSLLQRHIHPSVRAFALALLDAPEHGISFQGDPIVEFNLWSFLDRFAYKNPKQKIAEELNQQQKSQDDIPINLEFAKQANNNANSKQRGLGAVAAPDKQFFYKFFSQREALVATGNSKRKKKSKKSDDDDEENLLGDNDDYDDDGLDEEEVDNYVDKLARDMLRANGEDPDEDDFDEDDDDDEDDFDGDDDEFDELDGDDKEDDNEDDGEEDDDDEFGFEENALDLEEFVASQKKSNSKDKRSNENNAGNNKAGKKRKNDEGDFADADAFEAEMDANVKAFSVFADESNLNESTTKANKSSKPNHNKKLRK